MKKISFFAVAILVMAFFACDKNNHLELSVNEPAAATRLDTRQAFPQGATERVVTCNRISKDLSVIDPIRDDLITTVPMPDDGEPMYVVHIPQAKAFFVGDRANNRVVAFDEEDFSVKGTIPAGAGIWHMWASHNGHQLWVNNDIDKTTTVINPISMKVRGTVATPADLVALGGKPHDVFVDPIGKFAYVSIVGVAGEFDYVVKYHAYQLTEVDRVAVGKDPHLSATAANDLLYVPCQNSNAVYLLKRSSLDIQEIIPLNGAHGAIMSNSSDYFYTTDIGGSRIATISTSSNEIIGTPLETPFPTAHNVVTNASDSKLFLTHSGGTADKLTIYSLSPTPEFVTSVTVGVNPFGLTYYKY